MSAEGATPRLRPLSERDVEAACVLSQAVGWPHTPRDWRQALALGRGLGAESGGRLVGTAVWWPFEPNAGTLGLVIVTPDLHGRGIGKLLLEGVIDDAAGRTLLLNATGAAQALYARAGFRRTGEASKHQGIIRHPPDAAPRDGAAVRPLEGRTAAAVWRLDRRATGLDRARVLQPFLDAGRGLVLERGEALAGYALVRPFAQGHVVGPVIASSDDDARMLISAALAPLAGQWVRIDLTAERGLADWLAPCGAACEEKVTAMVRGTPPATAPDKHVFALASHAYG